MQRTLERIERIRTLSINDENIMILLDEAKLYLNVTAAKEMLAEDNVTGVAHNLTEANQLISQAYQLLRKEAKMNIWKRMGRYLNNMERSSKKILMKIALAKKMGVNVSAILEELGYKNETEFREALLNMIMTAHNKSSSIKEALLELKNISQTFWRMDKALTRHLHQPQWRDHEPRSEQSQNQTRRGSQGAGLGKSNSHNNSRRGRP